MMLHRAEERFRAESRGFGHHIDSYGSYVYQYIHITDRFHDSPYGLEWIHLVANMDSGDGKLTEF